MSALHNTLQATDLTSMLFHGKHFPWTLQNIGDPVASILISPNDNDYAGNVNTKMFPEKGDKD